MNDPIAINVLCGNLVNVEAPVYALGIFEEIAPKVALATVDALLGGTIREMYRANRLDGRLGVVTGMPVSAAGLPAKRLCFVGLGAIDRTRPNSLRQVGANLVEHLQGLGETTLTTVPIGLGSGFAISDVTTYLVGGMLEAIAARRRTTGETVVRSINICDFDQRNCDAILSALGEEGADGLRSIADYELRAAMVARETAGTGRAWDPLLETTFLHIRMGRRNHQTVDVETLLLTPQDGAIVEQQVKRVDRKALADLASAFDGRHAIDFQLGQRIAALVFEASLIRRIVEAQKAGNTALVLLHDQAAAVIPWEALSFPELAYPATTFSISRRLIASGFTARSGSFEHASTPLRVLLVVDPTEDLDGARREGEIIEKALHTLGTSVAVTPLWQRDATRRAIMAELGKGSHDIVHFAGHAFFDPRNPSESGILCAGEEVLTGADASVLPAIPRMAVFNACESGRIRRGRGGKRETAASARLRAERGVGLAEAFMRGGVQHFLGTFWPVGDKAAEAFADTFYLRLLRGEPVGTSIARARQAVRRCSQTDWADYIHYGDPTDRLRLPDGQGGGSGLG